MGLLHGHLVILVLWQISQFRSPGKWVHAVLPKSTLMRRTGVWVSARFSLNSCSHSETSEKGLPVLTRGLSFNLFFWIWVGLVNGSLRSFLSTCPLDTDTAQEPHKSSLAVVSLSLDTIEDVIVGEVDKLEEDAGWSLLSWRCHRGWRMGTGGRTCW